MPQINPNTIITYAQLTAFILEKIQSKVKNIGSFASDVPLELQNGYTFTRERTFLTHVVKGTDDLETTTTHIVSMECKVEDSVLTTVPLSTVTSQFNAFLTQRGIASESNEKVSFKGILNFFANAASFLSTKLILVTSPYVGVANSAIQNVMFYDKTDSSSKYPVVHIGHTPETMSKSDALIGIEDMINAVNNKLTNHLANTTVQFICSSCSSSSSSSCSSSSSSSCSSSSFFIAYMDI